MDQLGFDSTIHDVIAAMGPAATTTGRRILVTGASTGLGERTTAAFASQGAHVLMAVRDRGRGEAAIARLADEGIPSERLELVALDLESLASIRRCASDVLERSDLDLFVANAGIMACPEGRTFEGFERQMGTNHLGHHLLASLLTDALATGAQRRGEPSRIVALSSRGHVLGDVDLDDVTATRAPYDPFEAYGASKTANILFALEADRRLTERGIRAFSVHPGGIRTELGRHMTPELISRLMATMGTDGGIRWKTPDQGAATTVWASLDPDLIAPGSDRGGSYCEDCGVAPITEDDSASHGVAPRAVDPERAARLWEISDVIVGGRGN
jgi:NAD(P)-dependent dehydrogenase (short-subunit alcohol dehydrogenase family)